MYSLNCSYYYRNMQVQDSKAEENAVIKIGQHEEGTWRKNLFYILKRWRYGQHKCWHQYTMQDEMGKYLVWTTSSVELWKPL